MCALRNVWSNYCLPTVRKYRESWVYPYLVHSERILYFYRERRCKTRSCIRALDLVSDVSSMMTVTFFQVTRHRICFPSCTFHSGATSAVHPRSLDDMWDLYLCKRLDTSDPLLSLMWGDQMSSLTCASSDFHAFVPAQCIISGTSGLTRRCNAIIFLWRDVKRMKGSLPAWLLWVYWISFPKWPQTNVLLRMSYTLVAKCSSMHFN